MNTFHRIMESLRPLVGINSWDYCVLWRLNAEERCIEFMGCCCGGAEGKHKEEEQLFPLSPVLPCRDAMFQHPRTEACDTLAQLPFFLPLDSGDHMGTLIDNQPRWLSLRSISNSDTSDGIVSTKVLIPVTRVLVELFIRKHVPEDQETVEFVMVQCNNNNQAWAQEEAMNEQNREDPSFHGQTPIGSSMNDGSWTIPLATTSGPPHLTQWDGNQLLCNQQPNFSPSINHGFQEMAELQQPNPDSAVSKEMGYTKETGKRELDRPDAISDCSDQMEADEEVKVRGRAGRRGQAKNLLAERRRRKKLNERLYTLRSLVPTISKMDKASILGDAIVYIEKLQQQAKDLQDELEEATQGEDGANKTSNVTNNGELSFQSSNVDNLGDGKPPDQYSSNKTAEDAEQKNAQGMEPQLKVNQLDGHVFYLKILCEDKPAGFVRLMEAMDSLALEVTNANVTSFRGLVLNIFTVERRDDGLVKADEVRDSLLELIRGMLETPPEGKKGYGDHESHEYHLSSHQNAHHHLHHHHFQT